MNYDYRIKGRLTITANTRNDPRLRVSLSLLNNSCAEPVPQTQEDQVHCDGVNVNQEVTFVAEVTLDPVNCRQQATAFPLEFDIEVFGQAGSRLHVTLEPQCSCGCSAGGQGFTGACTDGRGSLVCGACNCPPRYQGDNCECETDGFTTEEGLQEGCRPPAASAAVISLADNRPPLCNGYGECRCSTCTCRDPHIGPLCDCVQADCGNCTSGTGTCRCLGNSQTVCDCHPGWSRDPSGGCGCSLAQERCQDPLSKVMCNGNGVCECNTCRCGPGHQGAFCQLPVFESLTGLDEQSCQKLEPCVRLDALGHLLQDDRELEAWQAECNKTSLKAQKR